MMMICDCEIRHLPVGTNITVIQIHGVRSFRSSSAVVSGITLPCGLYKPICLTVVAAGASGARGTAVLGGARLLAVAGGTAWSRSSHDLSC